MGRVGIDFDDYEKRMSELKELLTSLSKPFKVRISGGKKGLHIIAESNDPEKLREMYDDRERLVIDRARKRHGLCSNILLRVKCICGGEKVAGDWVVIKNNDDLTNFWRLI
ncbi:MAG: hypothetical protein A2W22_02450 [Candidatus Levybacteria bacterium RBG_16_35_11]|nr:MAG: hypothetical protein A2W22_02450 [Candidatus Levybacteria bacterium RBG_16_35_11]